MTTPEELYEKWKADKFEKKPPAPSQWRMLLECLKFGSILCLGFFSMGLFFHLLGRLFNFCELARWIFCKEC